MSMPYVHEGSRLSIDFPLVRNSISFLWQFIKHRLPVSNLTTSWNRYKVLWYLHEMEVGEFFSHRLWRSDLSKERYSCFIGWKKHILSLIALNPVQYRCLTENKLIFHTYSIAHGIPTPEIYAIYDPHLRSVNGLTTVRTVDQLVDFISRRDISQFVIKPVEGTRGQSVLALFYDKKSGEFRSVSGELISMECIGKVLEGYNYRGLRSPLS